MRAYSVVAHVERTRVAVSWATLSVDLIAGIARAIVVTRVRITAIGIRRITTGSFGWDIIVRTIAVAVARISPIALCLRRVSTRRAGRQRRMHADAAATHVVCAVVQVVGAGYSIQLEVDHTNTRSVARVRQVAVRVSTAPARGIDGRK